MKQVRPCKLDNTGKRLRPTFDIGFPGLECAHGSCQKQFFYHTDGILCDNHQQIANHILTCSHVPQEVKERLKRFKASHSEDKRSLAKGSQKHFFAKVWDR